MQVQHQSLAIWQPGSKPTPTPTMANSGRSSSLWQLVSDLRHGKALFCNPTGQRGRPYCGRWRKVWNNEFRLLSLSYSRPSFGRMGRRQMRWKARCSQNQDGRDSSQHSRHKTPNSGRAWASWSAGLYTGHRIVAQVVSSSFSLFKMQHLKSNASGCEPVGTSVETQSSILFPIPISTATIDLALFCHILELTPAPVAISIHFSNVRSCRPNPVFYSLPPLQDILRAGILLQVPPARPVSWCSNFLHGYAAG
ncbi:hypothetical protein VTK26DRAFT_4491 [Humicola hyalothermophila]